MLTQLRIENFGLIHQLDLNFSTGLTVITGESGAGKSMLFDALDVLLGAKFDLDLLMQNSLNGPNGPQKKTLIEGIFSISPNLLSNEVLAMIGFESTVNPANSSYELHIKRSIDTKGKSKFFLQNQACSMREIKCLAPYLLALHTQHGQHTLLSKQGQIDLVDAMCFAFEPLANVQSMALKKAYAAYHQAQQKLKEAEKLQNQNEAEQRMQIWFWEQLDQLKPELDEWEKLQEQQNKLANAAHLEQTLLRLSDFYIEEGGLNDILHKMQQQQNILQKIDGALGDELQSFLNQLDILQEECVQWIKQHHLKEFDAQDLESIEQRMQAYLDTARKLRLKPEELWQNYDHLQKTQNEILDYDIEYLTKQCHQTKKIYDDLAKDYSALREKTIEKFQALIQNNIEKLGMLGQQFFITLDYQPNLCSENGSDAIEFYLQQGGRMQTLAKSASGGELSRILLAILNAIHTHHSTTNSKTDAKYLPTLCFDESDAGMSGMAGEAIGRMLAELAQGYPILLITHLAQVAAWANKHLYVNKEKHGMHTKTQIIYLEHASKIQELARLISGEETAGDTAIQHANHLFTIYQKQR